MIFKNRKTSSTGLLMISLKNKMMGKWTPIRMMNEKMTDMNHPTPNPWLRRKKNSLIADKNNEKRSKRYWIA